MTQPATVFALFAPPVRPADAARAAITAAARVPEPVCVPPLVEAATLPPETAAVAQATAHTLIERLRAKPQRGGVQALVQEYALSSQEGVALMCLAEALLRIPDMGTRDALIRDKIAGGDWAAHLGEGRSLFVNAATWGLVVTGKLTSGADDARLSAVLTRMIARLGEPVIRRGVDIAMRMMGEQFVTGETIAEALKRAKAMEARGFTYSYDMLGEAAATADDAARYLSDYQAAIHAIGKASAGRGVLAGPGISIKLSALHPRYVRAQAGRVMDELLPRVKALALLARSYDIGLNIDAEEADRLELSLDLLEALAADPALAGWNGLGFVVQAYGKRCPAVIDHIVALARSTGRRIMVRLVKGAYWDAEIKRAQVDGLTGYPVYTRKIYTDVSYIACARKLLGARDAVFPQFATHNAQTLATIYAMAGPDFTIGDYEFQCLHGMGEPLYDEVVGAQKLGRPCRIYAPVGTHETLLAYLVRRLLENGANSSFVNRIGDADVPVEELIADPVETVRAMAVPGAPHDQIALPAAILGDRRNSAGLDLSDETVLTTLGEAFAASATQNWIAAMPGATGEARAVRNPADRRDIVGHAIWSNADEASAAAERIDGTGWAAMPVEERAQALERAADLMQARMPSLMGLIIREAGKSAANAVAEVREAVDFLRYYAQQARASACDTVPIGVILCISPWNFPLAIFTGQVSAALAAGNAVLAKPAEETPLIAAQAVAILHEAGVLPDALILVPGDGATGAALVAAPQVAGVMFTGSTDVARHIQRTLADRTDPRGGPIPLIAETGGQNAMIVDSSALAEQVVADVVQSAFDSAGQRCSALRLLCLQEDVADRTIAMLKGAMAEMATGNPAQLRTDIGPVISEEAKAGIDTHVAAMRAAGKTVTQGALPAEAALGSFVPPTIIEIDHVADLTREVFGPVLHVLRYKAGRMDALIDAINATGYGLTFGLHTRLDSVVARVTDRIHAGNLYINRNIIGAVVGVQPFGGHGLSGTGPKAGGPLYLTRLVANPAATAARPGNMVALPGPVGETNLYRLRPRGAVALVARSREGLLAQIDAVLATGNTAVIDARRADRAWVANVPPVDAARLRWSDDALADSAIVAALVEGDPVIAAQALAARDGAVIPLQMAGPGGYVLDWLLEEVSISTNTTAAGGNASLMALS